MKIFKRSNVAVSLSNEEIVSILQCHVLKELHAQGYINVLPDGNLREGKVEKPCLWGEDVGDVRFSLTIDLD